MTKDDIENLDPDEDLGPCVVMVGNIASGYEIVGPFKTSLEALQFIEGDDTAGEAEILPVVTPAEYKEMMEDEDDDDDDDDSPDDDDDDDDD